MMAVGARNKVVLHRGVAAALVCAAASGMLGGCGKKGDDTPAVAMAAAQAKSAEPPRGDAARRLFFEKQCLEGRAGMCGELATMWAFGQGGPKDKKKADEYHKRACDQAVVTSCDALGIELTPVKELEILEKNCSQGSAFACNNAGQIHFNGLDPIKPDQAKAMPALEKGCAGGYSASCRTLARVYALGVGGGVPNGDKAKEYLAQAEAADAALRAAEVSFLGEDDPKTLPVGRASSFTMDLAAGGGEHGDGHDHGGEKAAGDEPGHGEKHGEPHAGEGAPKGPGAAGAPQHDKTGAP